MTQKTKQVDDLLEFGRASELEELRIRNRFLSTILNNIPYMVFVKEAERLTFVLLNKAGENLLGLKNEQLLGKNDYDFFPQDQADFFTSKDRQVLSNLSEAHIAEEPLETSSGTRFLRTTKIPISGDHDEPEFLLGISEDITEELKKERTIKEQKLALEGAARLSALGEMAAGIAHEINNPLAIIKAASDHIERQIQEGSINIEHLKKAAQSISKTVDRIGNIVAGMKHLSRDGKDAPVAPVVVNELFEKALSFSKQRLRNQGIELVVKVDDPNLIFWGQEIRLSQVLVNLIHNAKDALEGVSQPKLHILGFREGERVKILVKDNGIGIPKHLQKKIMEPFFTTKVVGKGTGLGLSISRSIVLEHNGTFEVQSEEGNGSTFTISLPAKPRKG